MRRRVCAAAVIPGDPGLLFSVHLSCAAADRDKSLDAAAGGMATMIMTQMLSGITGFRVCCRL